MMEQMLAYQKKDAELINIERDIASSQIKKIVNKMVEIVKDAQGKLISIEKSAQELVAEFNALQKTYEKGLTQADKMNKIKYESLSSDELKELSAQATALNSNLLNMEKNISNMNKRIADTLGAFEAVKTHGMSAKQKHAEGLKAYEQFLASKQPEIDKINAELKKLCAGADKAELDKYKKLRDDKIFPVYVPLNDRACAGCSMELPSARLDKLKNAGVLECENCRRIIYMK